MADAHFGGDSGGVARLGSSSDGFAPPTCPMSEQVLVVGHLDAQGMEFDTEPCFRREADIRKPFASSGVIPRAGLLLCPQLILGFA